jgi:hypothetical protein
MKKLLFIILLTGLSIQGFCNPKTDIPSSEMTEVDLATTLVISGNSVHIENAPKNSTLEVYNVLGMRVATFKIDSSDKTITLNLTKGWYILKVDNLVRKIAIK